MRTTPLVTAIRRHSLEDGPGIRSVVFFKGCPLRCVFCHNPETQEVGPEVAFTGESCIGCGQCLAVCPNGAIDLLSEARIRRDRCRTCASCAQACPSGALKLIGTSYSTGDLLEILLRDAPYYRHSGGGVTFSGGEPTLFSGFLSSLLQDLKIRGVHTCLQTCGYFDFGIFEQQILPYLDLVQFDLKLFDGDMHRKYTGKDNSLILENLARLRDARTVPLVVRVPLVPAVTGTPENLSAIRAFLLKLGIRQLILLPYNPLGIRNAVKLGRQRPGMPENFMTASEEYRLMVSLNAAAQSTSPLRPE